MIFFRLGNGDAQGIAFQSADSIMSFSHFLERFAWSQRPVTRPTQKPQPYLTNL